MSLLPEAVRETIAEWLRSGEIDLFIGYEAGCVPLRATPAFVRRPEDVSRLIWDATCENSLMAFVRAHRNEKVGVMVKGCDARALVGLQQEGQLQREKLRLVGANCPGVVDARKVAAAVGLAVEDLDEATLDGEAVLVEGQRLPLAEMLHSFCATCRMHNPPDPDVAVGPPVEDAAEGDPFAHVREMEALDADARWARFTSELERCNLCYACRNACPLCYCETCFVDRTQPRWQSQTTQPEDLQFYQIIRTFHLAGRCVGCGACTRACPQGIDIRLFLDKLRLDVAELYQYEAGTDAEAKAPLATYRTEDDNSFIL